MPDYEYDEEDEEDDEWFKLNFKYCNINKISIKIIYLDLKLLINLYNNLFHNIY